MRRTGLLIVALAACMVLLGASDSWAQTRYRPGTPSRPRISPYLQMFGYGGDPYYSGGSPLLAPYMRQNQSTASRRQSSAGTTAQSVNPTVDRARAARATPPGMAAATGATGTAVAPTGTGSVFMQYSHYFQLPNYGGSSRGSGGRRPGLLPRMNYSRY